MATVQLLNNFIDNKFELITAKSRADMTLEDAENYMKSMMYTKGPMNVKTSKEEDGIKTRGKALFVNKNSFGIETNSVKKDAIRPNTARSGYSTLSVRNITTRGSSRLSQQRATSAISSNRSTKTRLFSADGKFRTSDIQSTAETENKSTLKARQNSKQFLSTQIIKPEDEEKLNKANKKLLKKFNQFLVQTSRRTGTHTNKLVRTMRSYVEQEITNKDAEPDTKIQNKRMSQQDMNVYFQLNLLKDMQNDK